VPPERGNSLPERLGRRFARFATEQAVARPWTWGLLRGPLRWQFDRLAPVWETRGGPEAMAAFAAALERVGSPARVLDLGTGTGKAARLAAERFPRATVLGLDLSPAMVEQARALLPPALAARVRFEVADASALPCADGEFELVTLLNMIPFFPELARVTAPGGHAVFAFYSGPATPMYVPPETLRGRLEPLGFEGFEELAAGTGTALVARKR
jgi:SAM-dependent methyltransferase